MDTMDTLQQLELMQRYLITLQTCKKCGTCFQNRNHIYQGQVPLCHRCRNYNRPPVVVIKYKSIDKTVFPHVAFREEYVVPIDALNIDMMVSLNALSDKTLISRCVPNENGIAEVLKEKTDSVPSPSSQIQVRKTSYPDSRGSLFHETFNRESFAGRYSPYRHDMIKMYQYEKEII